MKNISEEDKSRLLEIITDPDTDTSYMKFKEDVSNFSDTEEESK